MRRPLQSFARALIEALVETLQPSFCLRCGPLVDDDFWPFLCTDCAFALEQECSYVDASCRVCAAPLARSQVALERCLRCTNRRPAFVDLRVLAPLEGVTRDLIVALKYRGVAAASVTLGMKLAALEVLHLKLDPQRQVDLVLPMPTAADRIRRRGFNQAALLARAVAEVHELSLESRILRRRDGDRQVGKSRHERRQFDGRRFVVKHRRVQGRRILLVDDVVTTGATIQAASRRLKEAGAHSVRVLAVARTPE